MPDVEIIDRGWNAAMKAFAEMDGIEARAGLIGANEDVLIYGAIWEARTGWIRDTTDREMPAISSGLARLQNDLVSGRDGSDRAESIASRLADGMRASLSSDGLVDTGELIGSVGHTVIK